MARPEPDLAGVQRWMQKVILLRGDLRSALAAPEAEAVVPPDELETVLLPSRTLSAGERLGIYREMYPLRMQEALQVDYPALAHFLGEERFAALTRDYVAAHPSRSYTLNRLGDHLPDFIARTTGIPRRAVCEDLARLELAITTVFDAPESPVLDAEAVAAMGERVADLRLRPIEAFRLVSFRYPVDTYLQSVRDDNHDHPRIGRKSTWLAVFRRGYVIRRLPLGRDQHALLTALTSGATVGEAVMTTLRAARRRLAADEFFHWFRQWVGNEMFRALDGEAVVLR